MERTYTSKYGKIVKMCPGLNEYWYKGEIIARGSSISSADPREKPTSADWNYCVMLCREKRELRKMRMYQLRNNQGCVCDTCVADNANGAKKIFAKTWSGKFSIVADYNGIDDDSQYNITIK